MKTVSIIVRSKNEERWIGYCLSSIFNQKYTDFEVILVDNGSTDRTVQKARQYPVKVVTYQEEVFHPGRAINEGIRASEGKYIVVLSGHAIPTSNTWLENFVKEIESDPMVAGVYGKQNPLPFSSDLDKRDLFFTFGFERKVQTKDKFFDNANSIIKREIWDKLPFDESVLHIENLIWGKEVIEAGYKIIYTPDAPVYHYHGIHHKGDLRRAKEVVEVLEKIYPHQEESLDVGKLKVAGIIPIRGEVETLGGRPLIEYTLTRAKESKYLNLIAVATDNPKIADIARNMGIQFIFIYPESLSGENIEVGEVLRHCIGEFEKMAIIPDAIVYLSPKYPFRPKGLIDQLITELISGYDSVLPVLPEYRSSFVREEGAVKRLDKGFMASNLKDPLYTGLSGLATVAYADVVKKNQNRLGERIGMFEVNDLINYIDVGKSNAKEMAEKLIGEWWLKNQ